MRHLKMLGLAAVAAMGLMVFLGAGTASATTLCTTKDSPGCTMAYTEGTKYAFSLKPGTQAILKNTAGQDILFCGDVIALGTTKITSTAKGKPFPLPFSTFKYPNESCSGTVDTIANGELDSEWIEGTNNATDSGAGTEITVITGGISCVYGDGTGSSFGTLVGGETPEDNVSAVFTKTGGGFLCASDTVLDENLIVTEPHALSFTQ